MIEKSPKKNQHQKPGQKCKISNPLAWVLLFIRCPKRMKKIHLPVDGFFLATNIHCKMDGKNLSTGRQIFSIYWQIDFSHLLVDRFFPSTVRQNFSIYWQMDCVHLRVRSFFSKFCVQICLIGDTKGEKLFLSSLSLTID